MSTRNLPEGKGRPARGADNLTAICEPIVLKMWEPRRLTPLWVFTAWYRDSFTFCFFTFTSHDLVIQCFSNVRQLRAHYMGGRRTRRPLSYRNIPLSRKGHAIELFSVNRRKIIVKVAVNNFLYSSI
jgi:hypothetical protein